MSESRRVSMFDMAIDACTLHEAAETVLGWSRSSDRACRYVVTPNLDHVVQFQHRDDLRSAYRAASLVVADGWPLVAASRLFGEPLPERVAGSDLVPALFDEADRQAADLNVFLLGAAPGVAEIAAANMGSRWASVKVVGTYSPPLGFESDEGELSTIRERINAAGTDLLIVGFGAPKQELWLRNDFEQLNVGAAIAAGATIDFLAGRQKRAPVWMQRMNLEWSHRLLSHPRRLSGRYLRDAVMLPQLLWRERKQRAASAADAA